MWDKADQLNRAANVLFATAALLVVYGAAWLTVRLPVFALREVHVIGASGHVTRTQVESIVHNEFAGTFFTLDLPRVRRGFEKLPWVREVNLRRRWPARLEVSVVEHIPLARWGNHALVNTHGEVFHAAYNGKLPTFIGPAGTSKEISIQYDFFRRHLSALGTTPVLVQLTPRRAWQVKLESGPTLELGREDIEARLARYIAVHERTVGALKRRIDLVDLRYANGFAVRIPELKGEPLEAKRAPAAVKRRHAPASPAPRTAGPLRTQRGQGAA